MVKQLMPMLLADANRTWEQLRHREPAFWDDESAAWYVTRHADVFRLLVDRRLAARGFPNAILALPEEQRRAVEPVERFLGRMMVFSDEPEHDVLREALRPVFNAGGLEVQGAALRHHTSRILSGLPLTECDFVVNVARPLAVHALCEFLALDDQQAQRCELWSDAIIGYLGARGPSTPHALLAGVAINELRAFVLGEVLPARGSETARVLDGLVEAGGIGTEDAVATFAQVVTGAVEPLATGMAAAAVELARRPELGWSIGEGVPAGQFVEEVLRLEPPFQFAPRLAREDVEVSGRRIRAGEKVILVLASANRDPAIWPSEPDFASGRRPVPHLAFGHARHSCLGALLSRVALVAFVEVLAGTPVPARIELAAVKRSEAIGVTSFTAVPLARARV